MFEDEPLRPHKRSDKVNTMQELIDMENSFLPYDYTKNQPPQIEPKMVITTTSSKLTLINAETNILKRMGDKLDASKYKAQGYYELKMYDDASTTTVTKITAISMNK